MTKGRRIYVATLNGVLRGTAVLTFCSFAAGVAWH